MGLHWSSVSCVKVLRWCGGVMIRLWAWKWVVTGRNGDVWTADHDSKMRHQACFWVKGKISTPQVQNVSFPPLLLLVIAFRGAAVCSSDFLTAWRTKSFLGVVLLPSSCVWWKTGVPRSSAGSEETISGPVINTRCPEVETWFRFKQVQLHCFSLCCDTGLSLLWLVSVIYEEERQRLFTASCFLIRGELSVGPVWLGSLCRISLLPPLPPPSSSSSLLPPPSSPSSLLIHSSSRGAVLTDCPQDQYDSSSSHHPVSRSGHKNEKQLTLLPW